MKKLFIVLIIGFFLGGCAMTHIPKSDRECEKPHYIYDSVDGKCVNPGREAPDTPDTPDTPDAPDTPDTPDTPDDCESPG